MPFAVVDDEALNPVDVSLLSADAVMFASNDVPHLIKQFGLPAGGVLNTLSGMTAILPYQLPNSSRIRPKLWVFLLKCPKIGSNSR
jgi:hypothetical protein